MTAALARLALLHDAALLRAGVSALREVEDDSLDADVEYISQEGIVVEFDEPDDIERRRRVAAAAVVLLVSRLRRAAITRREILTMRDEHGEDALLVALSGVADGLGHVRTLNDREVIALHRARADARALLQSPHDVAGVAGDDADTGDGADARPDHAGGADDANAIARRVHITDIDDLIAHRAAAAERDGGVDSDGAPSTQVARDLASAIDGRPVEDAPTRLGGPTGPHTALLRLRVGTVDAARVLGGIVDDVVETDIVRVLSAPDEVILLASGTDDVATLLRIASSLATALPGDAALSGAIVTVGAGQRGPDTDVADDVVRDVVAAAALIPRGDPSGPRLALDDGARGRTHELAELPDLAGVVDPRAPWGQERWEHSALLARSGFRGRDDDVTSCAEVLRRGGDGARLLLLGGAAGMGKSSLVRAALREAELLDDRAALAWGATDTLQPTPWAAIVGMVRALARAPAGHPRATARVAALIHGLAAFLATAERQELVGYTAVLSDLLGASDHDGDDLADRRSPRALRTALRRAVLLIGKALLARAGDDRPLVLVVSGAEAMDGPTRDTLAFVARRLGARLRVVLLSSSPKLKLPAAFEEAFAVTRRDVRPLPDSDGLAIARDLLDVTDTDVDEELQKVLAVIVERAKGSPLHVAHATRWAVEGGSITRQASGTGWTASGVDVVAFRLPPRVDRLLGLRVQRLPTTARQVLGHCAALGSTFMPAAVEFVGTRLGLQLEDVRQAVRLLTETGFLARSQRRPGAPIFVDDNAGDDTLLVFEHPLLRAAAEQALADDEARAVHGVVADALEALLDTGAVAARLARHHTLAGRPRQAVQHLVTATRRARRLDDRQGAITMATEALELLSADESEVAFALHLELAAALELGAAQGEKAQAPLKEALKQLVRAADRTNNPDHQAIALARVARFNLFLGDLDRAEEAVVQALAKAREVHASERDATRPPRSRDVLRLLALIRFAARDLDGARRVLDEARRLTPDQERRVLGGIEHQTGLLYLESNDPLGALEHFLVAFAHKRATADLAGEAACLDAIADVYVRTGHLWTALSLLVRALGLREAIGDDAGHAQSLKNRADVLLMAGDIDAACDEAQRARALCRSLGLDRLERQSAVVVARAELARLDAPAAEAILDNIRRRVDVERDPFAAMETELLSARAKWLRAQSATGGARNQLLKSALSRARAAVELGEQRGFLSGQVLGHALLGELLLGSGDTAAALPHAQRAAELLDDRTATTIPVEDALVPWMKALIAIGDDDEARAVATRARSMLEERAARLPAVVRELFWRVPARAALLAGAATTTRIGDDATRLEDDAATTTAT